MVVRQPLLQPLQPLQPPTICCLYNNNNNSSNSSSSIHNNNNTITISTSISIIPNNSNNKSNHRQFEGLVEMRKNAEKCMAWIIEIYGARNASGKKRVLDLVKLLRRNENIFFRFFFRKIKTDQARRAMSSKRIACTSQLNCVYYTRIWGSFQGLILLLSLCSTILSKVWYKRILDTYENIKCVLSKFGKVSQKMRTIHNLVIFHNAIGSQCTHVPKVWCVFMFSRWFCEDTSEYILGLSSAKKFIVTQPTAK